MWARLDDGWWKHPKLRALPRSARGLLADVLSQCGDLRTDGFVGVVSMPMLGTSLTDPDLKLLVKAGMLNRKGDTCRCMDRRAWAWPAGTRGVLVHDFLDYSPSREENDVAKAQRAELRDPALRQAIRERDFARCRYCTTLTNPKDRRGDDGETLDHIDPAIAAGADNLVLACRGCNSAKKKRTPAQACMLLLDVADVREIHYAHLGISDPAQMSGTAGLGTGLETVLEPIQVGQADGPGRVGSGKGLGRVESGRVLGPPTTRRDSSTPNPYLRSAHIDPSLDPPPLPEDLELTRAPPAQTTPRSRRPSTKGRRR